MNHKSRRIELEGFVGAHRRTSARPTVAERQPLATLAVRQRAVFDLGAAQYRRSEENWDEAGRPAARVEVLAMPDELVIDVAVTKQGTLTFVPPDAVNPYDNEAPDINGDGVQLYILDEGASGWVLVPEGTDGTSVRARTIDGWASPRSLTSTFEPTTDGYAIRVRIGMTSAEHGRELAIGVVVNEKPFGRERRRGQLVLGGSPGEFVYLRGDREERDRLPRFRIVP